MVEELSIEQQEVSLACNLFNVSKSGYYKWLTRPLCDRKKDNIRLWDKIKKHWDDSRETYGKLRIQAALKNENESASKNRIGKIMKKNNIQGVGKKKFKPQTTDSNHNYKVADRIFKIEDAKDQVTKSNQYWGADITYIPTREGWLYLSVLIDFKTRKIAGYSMKDSMPATLIEETIEMAVKRQGIAFNSGLIIHSDRGSQYASELIKNKLRECNITASMSRKGNCYDNSMTETFFKTLKSELVYRNKFLTKEDARAAIFEYIEVWYNRKRLHSSLDYKTPEAYEREINLAA
jgi:transposase InsO family protein